MWWRLGGAAAILAMAIFLIIEIRTIGAKNEEIKGLRLSIQARDKTLADANRRIKDLANTQGVTAAQAARICAAEGSSAFDRGRAFGRAEKCAAPPAS